MSEHDTNKESPQQIHKADEVSASVSGQGNAAICLPWGIFLASASFVLYMAQVVMFAQCGPRFNTDHPSVPTTLFSAFVVTAIVATVSIIWGLVTRFLVNRRQKVARHSRVLQVSLVLVGAGGIALAWILAFGTKCDRLEKQEAEAFRAHDYQRAIALSTAVIEWGNDYGLMLRSRAHYQNGDLDKAIADVSERIRQLDAYPTLCPDSYVWRAALFLKRHDDEKAVHDLSKAIECDPSHWNVKAYYGRAAVFRRLGRRAEAERDYATAKQLEAKSDAFAWSRPYDEPDDGFVFDTSYSMTHAVPQQPPASASVPPSTIAPQSLRSDPFQGMEVPDEIRSLITRALNELSQAKFDATIATMTEAIRATPENSGKLAGNLYSIRASAHLKKGDKDAALSDCESAIRCGCVMPSVFFNKGCITAEKGNYQTAIADFNRAVELESTYAKTYHYRGMVYAKLGMREAADRDFAKAKELDPNVEKTAKLRLD